MSYRVSDSVTDGPDSREALASKNTHTIVVELHGKFTINKKA